MLVVVATRDIRVGEKITYDYKFPVELGVFVEDVELRTTELDVEVGYVCVDVRYLV